MTLSAFLHTPRHALLVIAVAFAALFALPNAAMAIESYDLEEWTCGGFGSGGYDADGDFYAACGQIARIVDYRTGVKRTVTLGTNAEDVAPSPDGTYLYVNNTEGARRLARQADGNYLPDEWRPAPFPYGGAHRIPGGYWVATDAFGFIYFTSERYHTVVKYAPDGTFITRFGEYTNGNPGEPSSWKDGEFYWRMGGVGVSRDGRQVYVTEVGNNRVQRFDWQLSGGYRYATKWGNSQATDPNRIGSCESGMFAAPYDVGVDPWGYVYVANTTCSQLQKFTKDGEFLYKLWIGTNGPAATGPQRTHGIAVDAHGNAAFGESQRIARRTTPEPGPWPAITEPKPDTTNPTLVQATLPATSPTRELTVVLDTADDTGVTQVRFANEDGTWQAWKAVTPGAALTAPHTLSANDGPKGVYIQVRDGAQRESTTLYRTTRLQAPAPAPAPGPAPQPAPAPGVNAAPVLESATVPATTPTREITVNIVATDDVAVTGVRFANEDGNWQEWKAFAAQATHTLSANDGPKGVYVQVRDARDARSTVLYKPLRLAAAAPAPAPAPAPGPAPAPAPGVNAAPVLESTTVPATTPTREITVNIVASDDVAVTGVRFANEDGVWQEWKAFAAQATHTLSANDGPKGVYVQVRDARDARSTVLYKPLRLAAAAPAPAPAPAPDPAPAPAPAPDRTAPTLRQVTLPATTATRTISVIVDAIDNVAVTGMRLANEDGNWQPWTAFSANRLHDLTAGAGPRGVYVQIRDAAGNESTVLYRTTRLAP